MKIKLKIEIECNGTTETNELIEINRESLTLESFGLTMEDGKSILQKTQSFITRHQAEEFIQFERNCLACKTLKGIKGYHNIVMRTVYGKLSIDSPRLYTCNCDTTTKSYSPLAKLFTERITPELLYIETKFASLMSFGLTVDILKDFLPIGNHLNQASVQNNLQKVAKRMERDLIQEDHMYINSCPNEWSKLPKPDSPLIVTIDGGYIHAREGKNRKAGWFEVITGRSSSEDKNAKNFGFVNKYDCKPKRRLYELLKSQGMQNNQQITFISDGGDTVRDIQMFLNPFAEHILDWFHITMKITVMNQIAKGKGLKKFEYASQTNLDKELTSIKWCLWHGNVYKAIDKIDQLTEEFELIENPNEKVGKFKRLINEFSTYIQSNAKFIPCYEDRFNHGEVVSSASAEAAVNQVISKQFVKKQQMRWTKQGAHLLLQTRTAVLNEDLESRVKSWYSQSTKIAA